MARRRLDWAHLGVALALFAPACGPGDGSTLDDRGRWLEHPYAPGLGSRFGSSLQSSSYRDIAFDFFEPFCVECHSGASPSKGLDLTYERAREEMLGVSALQRPGMALVEPEDPDRSYLIVKLEGTSQMVGRRMPRDRPLRPPEEIELVRAWIEAGAPRD